MGAILRSGAAHCGAQPRGNKGICSNLSFPDHHLSFPKIDDGHRDMIRVMAMMASDGNVSPRRQPQTRTGRRKDFFSTCQILEPAPPGKNSEYGIFRETVGAIRCQWKIFTLSLSEKGKTATLGPIYCVSGVSLLSRPSVLLQFLCMEPRKRQLLRYKRLARIQIPEACLWTSNQLQ